MKPINLPPLGEISLKPPASYAAIYDVVHEFIGNKDKNARLARILCAVIGMCWDNPGPRPPMYSIADGDPIAYGGDVLNWLVEKRVSPTPIYHRGWDLIADMQNQIPTLQEVDSNVDFSEPKPEVSTGT